MVGRCKRNCILSNMRSKDGQMMVIRDEERREVARKLRENATNDKLRKQVFVEEIIVNCIGEIMYDEWGRVREVEILTKLADLIEPQKHTCKIEGTYDDEYGIYDHLTCGHIAVR